MDSSSSSSLNINKVHQELSKEFHLPFEFLASDALTNCYYNYEKIQSMAQWLQSKTTVRPKIAIICGSGLGGIGEIVEQKQIIPYTEIPEFPKSTVHGHSGNLIFGNISCVPVVCMQGRFHPFEGYSLALCTLPIKLFKLLGCKMLILTNAAGILNRSYNVGDLMVIKDHISLPVLSLQHPLVGPNDERFGPRFPPINQIYGKKYRELFMECAKELSIDVREGVYSSIGGPSYETVSDSRFLIQIGADCVGMSTSHEAMVACYCGLKVLGFSILTDKVPLEFDSEDVSDHNEVIKIANRKAKEAEKLVARILEKLNENPSLIEN